MKKNKENVEIKKYTQEVFASRLATLLEERDMSLADLEKMTGIPKSTIARYANQKGADTRSLPEAGNVIAIADFFGVSLEYLLGLESDEDDVAKVASRLGLTPTALSTLQMLISAPRTEINNISIYNPWHGVMDYVGDMRDSDGNWHKVDETHYPTPRTVDNDCIISALLSDSNYEILSEILSLLREYFVLNMLANRAAGDIQQEQQLSDEHPEWNSIYYPYADRYVNSLKRALRQTRDELRYQLACLLESMSSKFAEPTNTTKSVQAIYNAIHVNIQSEAESMYRAALDFDNYVYVDEDSF